MLGGLVSFRSWLSEGTNFCIKFIYFALHNHTSTSKINFTGGQKSRSPEQTAITFANGQSTLAYAHSTISVHICVSTSLVTLLLGKVLAVCVDSCRYLRG